MEISNGLPKDWAGKAIRPFDPTSENQESKPAKGNGGPFNPQLDSGAAVLKDFVVPDKFKAK